MRYSEIGAAAMAGGLGGIIGFIMIDHDLSTAFAFGLAAAVVFTPFAYVIAILLTNWGMRGLGMQVKAVRLGCLGSLLAVLTGALTGGVLAVVGSLVIFPIAEDGTSPWPLVLLCLPPLGMPMLLAAPLWAWRRNYDKTHPPEEEEGAEQGEVNETTTP